METLFRRICQYTAVGLLGGLLWACGSTGSSAVSTSTNSDAPSSTAGNSVVSTVSKVSDMGVGDLYVVTVEGGSGSIDFSGASSTAEYMLMVQSAATSGGSSTVTLGDESAAFDSSLTRSLGIQEAGISLEVGDALDTTLRVAEEELAASGNLPSEPRSFSRTKSVGDQRSYKVLSSLSSTTSYTEVTGSVVCENSVLKVVLDDDDTASLSASDISDLCSRFKDSVGTVISVLGNPSDVNGDGMVTVLMTHRVNSLGGQGGGIVTGFFYAADLYPNTSSNPVSNEQEIVFVLVPDPSGTYGTAITKAFAMNSLLTAVVPHEVQHAISYNQHVLVRGGGAESTWLNEAMSHAMEERTGYGQENPSRVSLYLAAPNSTTLVTSGSASLKQRGASFLFLQYLFEQSSSGDAFLNRLVNTDKTSVSNINAAFAGTDSNFDQFEEFLFRWGIAVGMTNAGVISDSRYIYKNRSYNSTTSHWQGVCLQCSTEDGRSTTLSGPSSSALSSSASLSLALGSQGYYTLTPRSTPLSIVGNSSATPQAVLIRTK